MSKRYIRLKELGTNLCKIYEPTEKYLYNNPRLDKAEVFFIETNRDGNQTSIYKNKSPNKIYLIGGSTIESMYVRQSKRPHSILEKILLENGYDYSVQNLGASGTHLLNIINLIINKLGNHSGSIVVITLPSNDLGPLSYTEGYFSTHKYYSSLLPATDTEVEKNPSLDKDLYKKQLGFIKAICDLLGLKLIFTSICYSGDHSRLFKLNDIARNYCKDNGILFLDLEKKIKCLEEGFYDQVHFLPKGSLFFANELFKGLLPLLVWDDKKSIKTIHCNSNIKLKKDIVWSDYIEVKDAINIILTIDFKQLTDIKPALYSVDYDCKPDKTDLTLSGNKEIGYYRYISGLLDKRLEKSFDIFIPPNCQRLRIGLRSWREEGLYLYKSFISIIHYK